MPLHLMALWHYLEFLAGVNPTTNVLAVGIYSYNNGIQLKIKYAIVKGNILRCMFMSDIHDIYGSERLTSLISKNFLTYSPN